MAFECQICGDEFDKRSDLKEHEQICSKLPENNPVELQCSYCQKFFKSECSRKQHELQCEDNPDLHTQTEPTEMASKCQFCGKNFKRSNLKEHERTCPELQENNPDADTQTESPGNAQVLEGYVHCESCGTDFESIGYGHHKKTCRNSRCGFCHKFFESKRSREHHELQFKDKPDLHAQTEPSGSAQRGTDIFLGLHITRQKRTAKDQPLPKQHVKKPASDYAQGDRDPSVMQRQNKKLGDSSDHEAQTDSFSPIDDLSAIAANSEKQTKTIHGGVGTSIPEHRHPSLMQTRNKLPDLNLLPHNDSFSSMDDNAPVRADTISDKEEKKTDNGGVPADTNSDKENTGNGGVPADKNSNEEKKTDNGGVPADTNSDKEKTYNGGVDINNPHHKDPSVMQVQNKLDLNLPPRNDSFSFMDNLKTLAPIDTDSDKETNTVNAGVDTNSDKETNTVNAGVDTNSDKETNTVNAGVDTNVPDHTYPPAIQIQNKLDLNLVPHGDSSDSSV